jgi:phage gpG-like protein
VTVISAQVNQRQIAALEKKLDRFGAAMRNATPANRRASIALYRWVIDNFDSQGSSLRSGPWPPLAESTVREKARIGKNQMLVRSGELRSSFSSFYSRTNAGVRNTAAHAEFHEHGTAKMPQRKLFPERQTTLEIALKVYGAYVEDLARKAK